MFMPLRINTRFLIIKLGGEGDTYPNHGDDTTKDDEGRGIRGQERYHSFNRLGCMSLRRGMRGCLASHDAHVEFNQQIFQISSWAPRCGGMGARQPTQVFWKPSSTWDIITSCKCPNHRRHFVSNEKHCVGCCCCCKLQSSIDLLRIGMCILK